MGGRRREVGGSLRGKKLKLHGFAMQVEDKRLSFPIYFFYPSLFIYFIMFLQGTLVSTLSFGWKTLQA